MTTLLTVKQAAEHLNVSTATVYALCASGQLAHSRVGLGRGTIRIKHSELEKMLSQSGAVPSSAAPAARDWVFG